MHSVAKVAFLKDKSQDSFIKRDLYDLQLLGIAKRMVLWDPRFFYISTK